MRYLLLSFLLLFCSVTALSAGSKADYIMFENILLSQEALTVRCFIQDRQGVMWAGSDKGLFSFDGYTPRAHFTYGDSLSIPINCAIPYSDDRLLLGTQKGIIAYNCRSDEYEPFPLSFSAEVQALDLAGDVLWIGSMAGLFRYGMADGSLERIRMSIAPARPTEMVYSIIADETHGAAGGCVYVGSHIGFGRYLTGEKRFEFIIPEVSGGSERYFVNSLLKDAGRNCIWVGTGNYLYKYSPESNAAESKMECSFVKVMRLDASGNVVVGTDNGLCIYNEKEARRAKHDSRDPKSLANNIVWAVYTDREQNLWLGTDYGVSMLPGNNNIKYIPIHQLTGSGEGNHFYNIYKDKEGYFWLGGTNGLIRASSPADDGNAVWYMVDNPQSFITHNRIRHICEDADDNLWVTTDGGVNRYDRASETFSWCNIADSTRSYNSSWTYHIAEDSLGNLWMGTCMSGILVIAKEKLKTRQRHYVADRCYTLQSGLSGNFVSHIAVDRLGKVWALGYKTGIDRIDPLDPSGSIEHVGLGAGIIPSLILCDSEGYVWAAFGKGIVKINAVTLESQRLYFSQNTMEPLSMAEVGNEIWVSSSDGIWITDRRAMTTRRHNIMNRAFSGIYYDAAAKLAYLGGSDGLALIRPSTLAEAGNGRPVLITSLRFNNSSPEPCGGFGGKSIRYLDGIRLRHDRNTFSVEISDLNFSQERKSSFIYKLRPVDSEWQMLKAGGNSISFSNLEPGKYSLLIGRQGINGQPSGEIKTFAIDILPPWYFSFAAKCIYLALFAGLALWTAYSLKVRSQLRYARLEKEKTGEQIRLKLDFFTEISHEFKTPLSLIVAPLSRLLLNPARPPEERNSLSLIYRNAMKLSALVHQAIDFYRYDNPESISLIRSHVEFVKFAESIFAAYAESMKDRGVTFVFNSGVGSIYLSIDAVKMESVLNNLLTNACKYSSEGDNIMLSLGYIPSGEIEIKVSDTGAGIPEQDLPFVFQRYFQSSSNTAGKEGSGVGLYIAKKFVELHGGSIRADSGKDGGASFTIRLPIDASVAEEHSATFGPTQMKADAGKPLILAVDDNTDMAEFICNMFNADYRCVMAHNGKVGLKLAMELLPDLIIADVVMPVMDGLEMCRKLKAHVPTSTIPLILLTARDDKTTELNSICLNIDSFIAKPFDAAILLSRAAQLIDNKRRLEKKVRIEIMTEPKPVPLISHDEKLLANITRAIEENIDDSDLNVNYLSRKTGISPKQLYRKIKQMTGMSTIEYINSIRLKKAALLLSSKKFTVSEVMYMVGFNNHSYFAKRFCARFGKAPHQYGESAPK
ncbi:MAG: response regulator [Tannerellaceae bacterium]|jgi:signal transduction histidine kinase/ligand-binding sensor domain-containing protein/DNA-binding response OmpR family regulator|nr:response regulator [Tannerellaceae bacterium]